MKSWEWQEEIYRLCMCNSYYILPLPSLPMVYTIIAYKLVAFQMFVFHVARSAENIKVTMCTLPNVSSHPIQSTSHTKRIWEHVLK